MQDLAMLPDDRFVYSLHEPDATSCNYWVIGFDERTGALAGKPTRLTILGESCMDNTSVTADGKKLVDSKSGKLTSRSTWLMSHRADKHLGDTTPYSDGKCRRYNRLNGG
jgi:hypothetical protein